VSRRCAKSVADTASMGNEFWQAEVAGRVKSSAARSVTAPRARRRKRQNRWSRPASPETGRRVPCSDDPDETVFDPNSWEAGPTEEALTTLAVAPPSRQSPGRERHGRGWWSHPSPSPTFPRATEGQDRRPALQNPARRCRSKRTQGGPAPAAASQPAVPGESAAAEGAPVSAAAPERPVPPPLPKRQRAVGKGAPVAAASAHRPRARRPGPRLSAGRLCAEAPSHRALSRREPTPGWSPDRRRSEARVARHPPSRGSLSPQVVPAQQARFVRQPPESWGPEPPRWPRHNRESRPARRPSPPRSRRGSERSSPSRGESPPGARRARQGRPGASRGGAVARALSQPRSSKNPSVRCLPSGRSSFWRREDGAACSEGRSGERGSRQRRSPASRDPGACRAPARSAHGRGARARIASRSLSDGSPGDHAGDHRATSACSPIRPVAHGRQCCDSFAGCS